MPRGGKRLGAGRREIKFDLWEEMWIAGEFSRVRREEGDERFTNRIETAMRARDPNNWDALSKNQLQLREYRNLYFSDLFARAKAGETNAIAQLTVSGRAHGLAIAKQFEGYREALSDARGHRKIWAKSLKLRPVSLPRTRPTGLSMIIAKQVALTATQHLQRPVSATRVLDFWKQHSRIFNQVDDGSPLERPGCLISTPGFGRFDSTV